MARHADAWTHVECRSGVCDGFGVGVRKTVPNMSQSWDPPDPDRGGDAFQPGQSNRSVGIVLLVLTALIAGGVVSYVLSQWQDARSGADAAPTFAPTLAPTIATTIPATTTTTTPPPPPPPASTTPAATSTIPATTTTAIVVVGDHMVFADGYPLGHISADG